MYVLKIGDKKYKCPDLDALAKWYDAGKVQGDAEIRPLEGGEWQTVQSVLFAPDESDDMLTPDIDVEDENDDFARTEAVTIDSAAGIPRSERESEVEQQAGESDDWWESNADQQSAETDDEVVDSGEVVEEEGEVSIAIDDDTIADELSRPNIGIDPPQENVAEQVQAEESPAVAAQPKAVPAPAKPKKEKKIKAKKEAADPNEPVHCGSEKLFDPLLGALGVVLSAGLFRSLSRGLQKIGYVSIMLAAVLGLAGAVVMALRMERMNFIVYAIGAFIGVIVLQYTAVKLIPACDMIVQSSKNRLSSDRFLKSIALLMVAGAVAALLVLGTQALESSNIRAAVTAIGAFLALLASALLALNPSLLNIETNADNNTGEEAIAVIAFFVKSTLKLLPIVFGVVAVAGLLNVLMGGYVLLTEEFPMAAMQYGTQAGYLIGAAVLMPLGYYLFYLLYYLLIELAQALLVLPAKVDAVAKALEKNDKND